MHVTDTCCKIRRATPQIIPHHFAYARMLLTSIYFMILLWILNDFLYFFNIEDTLIYSFVEDSARKCRLLKPTISQVNSLRTNWYKNSKTVRPYILMSKSAVFPTNNALKSRWAQNTIFIKVMGVAILWGLSRELRHLMLHKRVGYHLIAFYSPLLPNYSWNLLDTQIKVE